MSDNILKLIPTDPIYIPNVRGQEAARNLLASIVPNAEEVSVQVTGKVGFIDCGANLSKIICPHCHSELKINWWHEAMARASANNFQDLMANVPCCNASVSLNELEYDFPAGFARFALEARNPGVQKVEADKIRRLEFLLGTRLREIWAHY